MLQDYIPKIALHITAMALPITARRGLQAEHSYTARHLQGAVTWGSGHLLSAFMGLILLPEPPKL